MHSTRVLSCMFPQCDHSMSISVWKQGPPPTREVQITRLCGKLRLGNGPKVRQKSGQLLPFSTVLRRYRVGNSNPKFVKKRLKRGPRRCPNLATFGKREKGRGGGSKEGANGGRKPPRKWPPGGWGTSILDGRKDESRISPKLTKPDHFLDGMSPKSDQKMGPRKFGRKWPRWGHGF